MRTMKTPSFTAESSLYESRQHYQMTATSKSSLTLSGMTVFPQLFRLWPGAPSAWDLDDPYGFYGGSSIFPFTEIQDSINPGIGDVRERQSRVCVARCNRIIDPVDKEDCLFYCNT